LTQLIFAVIVPASNPAAVAINLVAGAVSEAGAQQAGDIMQDLKTGHIIGAAPRAQFYGQLIGSVFGAIISAGVYRIYSNVYPIPGNLFQVPTAYVWIDCSRLVYGEGLPQGVKMVATTFAVIFAVTTVLRGWVLKGTRWTPFIPGGVAVAVGECSCYWKVLITADDSVYRNVQRAIFHSRKSGGRTCAMVLGQVSGKQSENHFGGVGQRPNIGGRHF
jgi:uncharacterized oligopeptide transporter (OPT) family protein